MNGAPATGTDPYSQFARYYDLEHASIVEDLDFYRQFAYQANGPILELGCGTGRVLAALIETGLPLTGIDNSPSMLAIARERLGNDVQLVHGSMESVDQLDLPSAPFWMVYCALHTFQHLLTTTDQLAALRAARKVVVPGGLLLLDLMLADPYFLTSLDGRLTLEFSATLPNGDRLDKFTSRTHNLATQTIDTLVLFDTSDATTGLVTRVADRYALRYVHRYELEHLLEHAGWQLVSMFGSYGLEEFGPDAERMIALATWN